MNSNSISAAYIEYRALKDALFLCVERGIPAAYTLRDIDELWRDDRMTQTERFEIIRRIHRSVRELLYAPPGRN